jgi:hypothetical protein
MCSFSGTDEAPDSINCFYLIFLEVEVLEVILMLYEMMEVMWLLI